MVNGTAHHAENLRIKELLVPYKIHVHNYLLSYIIHYSCGTTEGERLTKAQQTLTSLSIVVAS